MSSAQGSDTLFRRILDATLAILHSDSASIQRFYPKRGDDGELRLLGHRGFSPDVAKRWEWVSRFTQTTCGEALRAGRIPDIRKCDFMAGSKDLEGLLEVFAAQTTPLVSRSGGLLGMVTAYWRQPHEMSEDELRSFDILARLAADLIEQKQTEELLRASEAHLMNAQRLARLGSWERDDVTGKTETVTFARSAFHNLFQISSAGIRWH